MNCLLAAATAHEIAGFLTYYRQGGNKQDIDILITGVGLTAATYALAKQISLKKPDLIIQAGIAGCFDKNISPGSVVVIKQDTVADQMVIEKQQLKTMFDLGLVKFNQPPFKNGWLMNPHKQLIRQTKLNAVQGISVNHITTDRRMIGLYREKFNATVESMEGAALHYTCLQEQVPFLQLRSISNEIGERNKKKWNLAEAITNLNNAIIHLTKSLNSQPQPLTSTSTLNLKPSTFNIKPQTPNP